MIRGDQFGAKSRRPGSRQQLSRFTSEGSNLSLFLYPYLWEDVSFVCDDFLGGVLNANLWVLAADATATTFAIPPAHARGGVIQGSTGATLDGYHSIGGGRNFCGDGFGGFEARLQLDVATGFQLEVGFANNVTDRTLPVVTAFDTEAPAVGNGATDLAVLHLDTTIGPIAMAVVTEGSTAGMTPRTRNLVLSSGAAGYVPPAAAWFTLRMQLAGDSWAASVYESTALVAQTSQGQGTGTGDLLEGGTNVAPWLIIGTRDTTAKVLQADFLACWGDRS